MEHITSNAIHVSEEEEEKVVIEGLKGLSVESLSPLTAKLFTKYPVSVQVIHTRKGHHQTRHEHVSYRKGHYEEVSYPTERSFCRHGNADQGISHDGGDDHEGEKHAWKVNYSCSFISNYAVYIYNPFVCINPPPQHFLILLSPSLECYILILQLLKY